MNEVFPFTTRVELGEGAEGLRQFLQANVRTDGHPIVLVAGGRHTKSSNSTRAIISALEDLRVPCVLAPDVSPNPRPEEIRAVANICRESGASVIVSTGGGSSHDVAKVAAVLARQSIDFEDMLVTNAGYERIGNDTLPVICIPTVIGTGAEVSPAGLVRIEDAKQIIFSPHMYPVATYCDPQLAYTGDPEVDLLTGFDAVVQSLEAYTSRTTNEWSDMFSLAGLHNSVSGLNALSRNHDDMRARRQLMIGALQGLFGVSRASVGAIHALSDPLSGRQDLHHGFALSLVAKRVIVFNVRNVPASYERYERVATVFSEASGLHVQNSGLLGAALERWLVGMLPNYRARKRAVSIRPSELDSYVADSFNPDMTGNVVDMSSAAVRGVFEESLSD